jgi:hypothetical protein
MTRNEPNKCEMQLLKQVNHLLLGLKLLASITTMSAFVRFHATPTARLPEAAA